MKVSDVTDEDLEMSPFGILLRCVEPEKDQHFIDFCDWWIMRNGSEEPWPEHELEIIEPAIAGG